MAAVLGPETVCKAQERYCVDRQSFAQIAAALGISASTVRRWAERQGWDGEREAIAKAEAEIRVNTVKARAFALRRLLEAQSGMEASQAAFAVAALERLAMERITLDLNLRSTVSPVRNGRNLPADCAKPVAVKPAGRGKATKGPEDAPSGNPGVFAALSAQQGSGGEKVARTEDSPFAEELGDEDRIRLLEDAIDRQLAFVLAQPVDDLAKRIKEIKAALDVLASIRGKDARGTGIVVSFAEEEK